MTSFLFSSLRPFASHSGVSRAGNHEVTGLIPSVCVLMGDLRLGVRLAQESEPIIATGSTFRWKNTTSFWATWEKNAKEMSDSVRSEDDDDLIFSLVLPDQGSQTEDPGQAGCQAVSLFLPGMEVPFGFAANDLIRS